MSKDSKSIEDKIVFGISPGQGDDVPLVLLGIPSGAWEHMKDGKTHTFDFTKVGLPVKIMLYGAKDHSAAMKMIEGHLSENQIPYLDERRRDFSIKEKDRSNG